MSIYLRPDLRVCKNTLSPSQVQGACKVEAPRRKAGEQPARAASAHARGQSGAVRLAPIRVALPCPFSASRLQCRLEGFSLFRGAGPAHC